nr:MAG TPA: hypothetical protein [Caudoviricetes sp.]
MQFPYVFIHFEIIHCFTCFQIPLQKTCIFMC